MTIIILVCLATATFMVWCTVQQSSRSLRCVLISPLLLMDWRRHQPSLIIIELRQTHSKIASEALTVPITQLNGLLRWIPPQTTLVVCGKCEFDLYRAEIERTLLSAGIEIVYILDRDPWWSADHPLADLKLNWEPRQAQGTFRAQMQTVKPMEGYGNFDDLR